MFIPLLDHLATANHVVDEVWRDWRIQRLTGGWNNLLYRATNDADDVAIKFTIRDERDRAGREYDALRALEALGLDIAPKPVRLERERYTQPVVVQTWLHGAVSAQPPQIDDEWQRLLEHYATIHSITPAHVSIPLRSCILGMRSAHDGIKHIQHQVELIPSDVRPREMQTLMRQVAQRAWVAWHEPQLTLCRTDPNPSNLIRRAGAWASVDWENSGWGDPAFEVADLLAHPAFLDVPVARREWFIAAYAERHHEETIRTRMHVYYDLMLVWWVARFARSLYEVPRGGDPRLVERPANWLEQIRAVYERYVQLANGVCV